MVSTDPVIKTLSLLSSSWSLTGNLTGSNLKFGTYWLRGPPDVIRDNRYWVVVKCFNPRSTLLTTGAQPLYRHDELLTVGVYVRVDSDRNATTLGQGKADIYGMQKEVERVLFSGSRIATGSADGSSGREDFLIVGNWREMDETNWLPILYRRELEVNYCYHESGST